MPDPSAPLAYAFGAHPDDVEIYCLGLLLRLQALGWRIGWAVATDGARGGDPAVRRAEALAAAARHGVSPQLLECPDGAIAACPHAAARVAGCLAAAAPALVVGPPPWDYHPDHRALARLVIEACPLDCALVLTDALFACGPEPDVLVDVTAHEPARRAAVAAHASQAATLAEADLAAWSRLRALQTFDPAVRSAEAYHLPFGPGRARALAALAPVIVRTRSIALTVQN